MDFNLSDVEDGERAAINCRTRRKMCTVSEHVVPIALRAATVADNALKRFVRENRSVKAMLHYLGPKTIKRDDTAKRQLPTTRHLFQPARAAEGISPSAGARLIRLQCSAFCWVLSRQQGLH